MACSVPQSGDEAAGADRLWTASTPGDFGTAGSTVAKLRPGGAGRIERRRLAAEPRNRSLVLAANAFHPGPGTAGTRYRPFGSRFRHVGGGSVRVAQPRLEGGWGTHDCVALASAFDAIDARPGAGRCADAHTGLCRHRGAHDGY